MADGQALADQLGWCITTRDYLHNLQGEVRYVARKYYDTISFLRDKGYFQELLRQLESLCEEFSSEAERTVRHIEEDINYINMQLKNLDNALQEILGR